jgi:hypothetical protein
LYTFSTRGLSGYGKISFNVTPFDSFIRLVTFSLEGEQFGAPGNQNYRKVSLGSDLYFRSGKMVNRISHKVFGYYIAASDLPLILQDKETITRSYVLAGYQLEKSNIINPYRMLIGFETGRSFLKTSLEITHKLSYNGKNSGLESRLFAGAMLKNDNTDLLYGISPGGRNGRELYLYQGIYPDRFGEFPNTLGSRQMTLSEGGLVTPVNDILGYSRWVCSLSLTSNLPGKASVIPVKPFVNLLLNDHGTGINNKSPLFFEAGFKAGMWNLFEIYFPLLVSDNINSIAGSFKNRIRFVFRLDKLVLPV